MNVLFICHANICRSFMAQELLKKQLPGVEVRSRGLYTDPACRVPEKVVQFLAGKGITASKHRAVQLAESDLKWADYVFFMETAHLEQTADRFAQYSDKFYLLADYALGDEKDISDPIALTGKAFDKQTGCLCTAVYSAAEKLSLSPDK